MVNIVVWFAFLTSDRHQIGCVGLAQLLMQRLDPETDHYYALCGPLGIQDVLFKQRLSPYSHTFSGKEATDCRLEEVQQEAEV
jgi:hypothetical protein